MEQRTWLTSARRADGSPVDVLMADGTVTEVVPAGASAGRDGDAERLDLTGYLLLPAPVEPHAHLDKTGTWDDVGCDTGELSDAVRLWNGWSKDRDRADILQRAERTLSLLVSHGTAAVRTHVAVHPEEEHPVAVAALAELRERWRHRIQLQIVAMLSADTPADTAGRALACGADLLGGSPQHSDDPAAEMRRLLSLARAHGVGLDVHTDECLAPAVHTLPILADLVLSTDVQDPRQPVCASHCVSLGQLPPDAVAHTARRLAEAGIGVVTLPLTNLYLQGRGLTPVPRGMTAVHDLLAAGVLVAGGGDNVADPFNPMGRADPLETASLLVTSGHLGVTRAYEAVSDAGRALMGLAPAGPEPGLVADLLAIRASSLAEAVGQATEDRLLFTAGRLVSRVSVRRETY
ncbi:amidohydrolase family protein [Streptomyces sp. WAC06614]|uniref:amidohydrolase family protein n=1 Tax=Streptomyces sp. WAC06614 TaxID=2487416 RepID=UPI000F7B8A5F|nr:amidohydrolase family protein [Streptomyces sp. WAC06614]RSS69853.1 cytosine deaminase [Streptomyces sp. WAC06614]